ncbi:MAG: lytic transglycosylase domain-containing protein [Elusimicrobia bacterium]|nr:lytic transglycosylase domain-containing protein [Elusimicrobiota bacterium]
MLRRLKILSFFLLAGFLILGFLGDIPGRIKLVESLLHPVFHKEIINHYAIYYQEDPLFVTALIKAESNFFKKAKSQRGARGLMQIMPNTAREIAEELRIKDFKLEQLENPETNIHFGCYHLSKLRKEFGRDSINVLAAYNAGSKTAKKWLRNNRTRTLDLEDIEFYETKKFTQNVLKTYQWLKKFQRWRSKCFKWYNKKHES